MTSIQAGQDVWNAIDHWAARAGYGLLSQDASSRTYHGEGFLRGRQMVKMTSTPDALQIKAWLHVGRFVRTMSLGLAPKELRIDLPGFIGMVPIGRTRDDLNNLLRDLTGGDRTGIPQNQPALMTPDTAEGVRQEPGPERMKWTGRVARDRILAVVLGPLSLATSVGLIIVLQIGFHGTPDYIDTVETLLLVASVVALVVGVCAVFFSARALQATRIFSGLKGRGVAAVGLGCGIAGIIASLYCVQRYAAILWALHTFIK